MKPLLDKIARARFLVIGDVMLDHYIWGDATRISPEAPVPVVDIFRDSHTAGGAANVALNLAAMGASAEVCGWIGQDEAGSRLRKIFEDSTVRFDTGLFASADRSTIVKTRVIVQHQQLCRLDREGRPAAYGFGGRGEWEALRSKFDGVDGIILSDYAKGFLQPEFLQHVIDEARSRGIVVGLDPKPKRDLAFRGPDLITPNRKEALDLAGIRADPRDPFPAAEVCARVWEKHAPRNLVVTMGEDGMLLSREGEVTGTLSTVSREVFDVSGAGDTVVAVLTAALAVGATLEEAAHLANAAAGVVVGKLGTATASPEEILARGRDLPA